MASNNISFIFVQIEVVMKLENRLYIPLDCVRK